MRRIPMVTPAVATLLFWGGILLPAASAADGVLTYSSSAQVDEAFNYEAVAAFERATGIKVEKFVGSSDAAVNRLMNGCCDIASTVGGLHFTAQDYGYVETPFCTAPLVVISNVRTPVRNISETQLRGIFAGLILNWRELGGPDEPIIVVVPGKNTGAFKNFRQLALKRHDIRYDFMAYKSTMVCAIVKRVPWSISFISVGAHTADAAIKIINIDGVSPDEAGYPYQQTFSFVTKGEPGSEAEALIDFTLSDEGGRISKNCGLIPLGR